MRGMIAGLVLGMVATNVAVPQTKDLNGTAGLELRMRAEKLQNGLPQAFTFDLVNRSEHDLRVAAPSVECGDNYDGSIWLRWQFVPLHSWTTTAWPRMQWRQV